MPSLEKMKSLFITRILCFCIVLWACVSSSYGQEQSIYIEKFTLDPMDQAANLYPKEDKSGNRYALVKVTPANASKFKFSFGLTTCIVDGVHDDELWIYVQKSARKISISREGFTPIKDQDLGMTLESGRTYQLVLSYMEPEISVQKQWLKFSLLPADVPATVKVKPASSNKDFEMWGQTKEGTITRNLECGRYQYQIIHDDYELSEGVVMLNQPDETFTEQVTLNPNFGYLQIDDKYGIAGAQIFVDDKLVGTIPYKSERKWKYGEYRLAITHGDLYKTYNATFTIEKGKTTTLTPRLESNVAETQIRVADNAEIYIDKKLVGTGTWRGPLKEGRYEVEARKERHKSTVKTITVKADEAQDIVLDAPTPITSKLMVSSSPLDAEIVIDGKAVGVTPMTISELIIGEHTVTLNRKNHKSETRQVKIEEAKATELHVELSDMAEMTITSEPTGAAIRLNGRDKGVTPFQEVLTSGDYDLRLTHNKYRTYEQRVHLDSSNPTLHVKMERQYQLPTCVYLQPTYQVGGLMAFGAGIGAYIKNFNVEAEYLVGSGKETLYWNYVGSGQDGKRPVEEGFSSSYYSARFGYGLCYGTRLRITPQVGVGTLSVSGNQKSKGNMVNATVGARIDYALASCVGLDLAPGFAFGVSESPVFSELSSVSSTIKGWGSGFNLRIGIYLFF